ncbi:MAG: serine/threonine-protein kinase [Bryobacterales bacterium]|nr:serine/threonine-protein kinase [Bryobacterales bacterium]
MIPESFAHYRVLSRLGAGGMGVVYKAFDTHLDRAVALKVLPQDRTVDLERKRRFVLEAKAASALNHPNIITIYEIGTHDGADFIAMEFVDGKTLEELIPKQGMGVKETVRLAAQMADGLAKAHGSGIVHRDLKPSNIMVDGDGRVKLLDFGLAKLTDRVEAESGDRTLVHESKSAEGSILGTVQYMSPEQAEGKKVDYRSDIFSFGAVLYEMITGRRAFQGGTAVSTLAAILKEEPKPVVEAAPGTPRDLQRIMERCLRKDRDRRYQSTSDLRLALEEIAPDVPVQAAVRRSKGVWYAGGVGLAVVVAAAAAYWLTPRSPLLPAYDFRPITADDGLTDYPAITRDGKLVAYASDRAGDGKLDIYVQQLSGGQPIRLTRDPADDFAPDFSPDGSMVAFHSDRQGGGIYVVPALGGDERLVARPGYWPRFSPDGKWILYSEPGAICVIPSQGGERRRIAEVARMLIGAPRPGFIWSPDGERILFVSGGSWRLARAEGGGGSQLFAFSSPSEWVPGRIIGGDRHLWEMDDRIDAKTVPESRRRWITNGAGWEAQPRSSVSGTLVFASRRQTTDLWRLDVDSNTGKARGEPRRITQNLLTEYSPSVSKDGKFLAYSVQDPAGPLLVRMQKLESGKETTMAVENGVSNVRPKISPDAEWIGYTRISRNNSLSISVVNVKTKENRKLCDDCGMIYGWFPDSSKLIFWSGNPVRFFTMTLDGRVSGLISDPKKNIHGAVVSPDGQWVAFHVPLPPEQNVYVAPLHNGQAGGEGEWVHITNDQFHNFIPWWSEDGNLLYFASNRDGFECIWAQRLDGIHKRPVGAAFEVHPFHSVRNPIPNAVSFGPAVARDFLIYSMGDNTANVWVGERK